MFKHLLGLMLGVGLALPLRAELMLPAVFSDHMVLQQKLANPVWGWDQPGTVVTVRFGEKTYTAEAGQDGKWLVKLAPAAASSEPATLSVQGTSSVEIRDVLVGEVWMCSGQSNMSFPLKDSYTGDLEGARAHRPNLRLLTVPLAGSQELHRDFKGGWEVATPANARDFSAIGFLFGRDLQDILDVPIGLIDNAWPGSAAEAWVPRDALEKDSRFTRLMRVTAQREAEIQAAGESKEPEMTINEWQVAAQKAKDEHRPVPRAPRKWLANNERAGNIFGGVVNPTLGYGLKGVIWYQGEANASRAYEYRSLFPFLIAEWRRRQGQGDFPFYWVQLADFTPERAEPGEAAWAELREAQTLALALPHTGQAVTIDLGEGKDIHPRNKYDVASRLVRWALVKDYGFDFPYHSPEYRSVVFADGKAKITVDCFGSRLRTFDVEEIRGLMVCGPDRHWRWAQGRVVADNQIEVWSDEVRDPIAVRYAWAHNPVCNLYSADGLPMTPFRTDDFELSTRPPEETAKP